MPTLKGKVFDCLADVQRRVYGPGRVVTSRPLEPADVAKELGIPEEQARAFIDREREHAPLQTPYEDPNNYSTMVDAAEAIEAAVTRRGMVLPALPALGSLPTGRVNAVSWLCDGEYVIAFHDHLFVFAQIISKLIALPMAIERTSTGIALDIDTAKTARRIDEDPSLVRRFHEAMYQFVVNGSIADTAPFPLRNLATNPYANLAGILRESMEFFVMGHEYAHIIKGHVTQTQRSMIGGGAVTVDEIVRNHQKEHEADALGVQLSIAAMQATTKTNVELSYWGADFFFTFLMLVENTISILRTGARGPFVSDSHPDAQTRRTALRQALPSLIPEVARDEAANAVLYGRFLQQTADSIWLREEHKYLEAHRRGIRPAAIWSASDRQSRFADE